MGLHPRKTQQNAKGHRSQKVENGYGRIKRHFAHVLSTYFQTSFCCILHFAYAIYLLLPPACTHLSFHLLHETLLISRLRKLTSQEMPCWEYAICMNFLSSICRLICRLLVCVVKKLYYLEKEKCLWARLEYIVIKQNFWISRERMNGGPNKIVVNIWKWTTKCIFQHMILKYLSFVVTLTWIYRSLRS